MARMARMARIVRRMGQLPCADSDLNNQKRFVF